MVTRMIIEMSMMIMTTVLTTMTLTKRKTNEASMLTVRSTMTRLKPIMMTNTTLTISNPDDRADADDDDQAEVDANRQRLVVIIPSATTAGNVAQKHARPCTDPAHGENEIRQVRVDIEHSVLRQCCDIVRRGF